MKPLLKLMLLFLAFILISKPSPKVINLSYAVGLGVGFPECGILTGD